MDDRVIGMARWGVAYPAGVVVVVVAASAAVGAQATGGAFLTTIVAAIVGLVALHDPQSPRRRARRSVRDDEGDDDDEDVTDPAASLTGHGSRPDPDEEPMPGRFDERSRRLAVFATGLFVLGWVAFFIVRGG